jgi:phosphatidylglycerol:prolipoprotein diacylglycerol transferase
VIPWASPGPTAVQLGPITLRWYGVLLATGALLALVLARRDARQRGEDLEALLATCCVALAGGIIGARAYYVIFHWETFRAFPLDAFAVWRGGMGIFGGVLGGVIAAAASSWWHRRSLGRGLDLIAPGLVLAQAIGRWGNFFNEEAFGAPTTLPWGLYISPAHRPPGFETVVSFHPTFLYESLWDLGVFALLFFLLRKRLAPVPGALSLSYLALYSLGRLPIEALRLDSEMLGPHRAAQVAAVGGVLVAGVGLVCLGLRRERSQGVGRPTSAP